VKQATISNVTIPPGLTELNQICKVNW